MAKALLVALFVVLCVGAAYGQKFAFSGNVSSNVDSNGWQCILLQLFTCFLLFFSLSTLVWSYTDRDVNLYTFVIPDVWWGANLVSVEVDASKSSATLDYIGGCTYY
jgi:hypothetical protein